MRQRLAIGSEVDMLSRDEFVTGVSGIIAGLVSLRQPPERIWWPFQLTADSAGNLGAGVSTISPGNGTLYQVPEGMTVSLHSLSYTVVGVNPGDPDLTAGHWTEVVADGIHNAPGVWFTPAGPGGWVVPTHEKWGSHGPVFHESQRITLCGTLAANAIVSGRAMLTLLARPHVMATRFAAGRSGTPPHRPPGTGVPGGPQGPSIVGRGFVNAVQQTTGVAG